MERAQGVLEWLRGTWGPGEPEGEALPFPEGLVELCDIPKGPGFGAQGLEQGGTSENSCTSVPEELIGGLAKHFQKS